MHGYLEILSGIVRVGPDCRRYGDPYTGAVMFSADAGKATFKGFVTPHYTFRELRSAWIISHRCLREFGLEPTFERIKHETHR